MKFEYSDDDSPLALGDTSVTIKDFLVIRKGAQEVRVDAKFDLEEISPESRWIVANIMVERRFVLHLMADEDIEKARDENQEYRKRLAQYEALPWYRKLFTRHPAMIE